MENRLTKKHPTREEEIAWARVCRDKKEKEVKEEKETEREQRVQEYIEHQPLLTDNPLILFNKLHWIYYKLVETREEILEERN